MKLPDGWAYTPPVYHHPCESCGHVKPGTEAKLTGPNGQSMPLFGGRWTKKDLMVVIDAHPGGPQ